jgi:hypothetical protein
VWRKKEVRGGEMQCRQDQRTSLRVNDIIIVLLLYISPTDDGNFTPLEINNLDLKSEIKHE